MVPTPPQPTRSTLALDEAREPIVRDEVDKKEVKSPDVCGKRRLENCEERRREEREKQVKQLLPVLNVEDSREHQDHDSDDDALATAC